MNLTVPLYACLTESIASASRGDNRGALAGSKYRIEKFIEYPLWNQHRYQGI
jgi:hypothetical protein